MAQSIALASKFQPILDEVYKKGSLTARMDAPTKPVEFGAANQVKVFKTSIIGMGDYSRSTGYPAGDVNGTWETLTLSKERGRAFSIDRMDDDETLGQAFGTLAGEYMRTAVIPEIDAYRFHAYSQASNIQKVSAGATLAANSILGAIDAAVEALDNYEVPSEGRLLYLSHSCFRFLNAAISRTLSNESSADRRLFSLDGMTVIPVPQGRFYTKIALDAGETSDAGGFAKDVAAGKELNFMLLHPSAVLQATKLNSLKIFSPDENQASDGWLVQHRIYHDAFVYENKAKGIYIHHKA